MTKKGEGREKRGRATRWRCLANGLVEEEWLADVFDLGDCAFEVESFGQDDFEDLLLSDALVTAARVNLRLVGRVTFCTLILWLVLLKMRLARIAFANRRAF